MGAPRSGGRDTNSSYPSIFVNPTCVLAIPPVPSPLREVPRHLPHPPHPRPADRAPVEHDRALPRGGRQGRAVRAARLRRVRRRRAPPPAVHLHRAAGGARPHRRADQRDPPVQRRHAAVDPRPGARRRGLRHRSTTSRTVASRSSSARATGPSRPSCSASPREQQWETTNENYRLLRRLWTEERVTWSGPRRPPLENAVTLPRPLQRPPRIWHGSATSEASVDLAAEFGDPLFSANVTNPVEPYAELVALLPRAVGALGPRPRRRLRRRGHARPTTAGRPRRRRSTPTDRSSKARLRLPAAARARAGVPDRRGLRRAFVGADRQPAADHRQGPSLPRAARPLGAAHQLRRRGPHPSRSTSTASSASPARSRRRCATTCPSPPWPALRTPVSASA